MPEDRTPYDGKPFYCKPCGLGFGEYMACEEPDCELESQADAEQRREQHLAKAKRKPVGKHPRSVRKRGGGP